MNALKNWLCLKIRKIGKAAIDMHASMHEIGVNMWWKRLDPFARSHNIFFFLPFCCCCCCFICRLFNLNNKLQSVQSVSVITSQIYWFIVREQVWNSSPLHQLQSDSSHHQHRERGYWHLVANIASVVFFFFRFFFLLFS